MRRLRFGDAVLVVLALSLLVLPAPTVGASSVTIKVLSNRPDLISGGNALVEVVLPVGTDPSGLSVHAGRRDVTDAFAVRADGRFYGLVEGLPLGPSELTVRLPDGTGGRLRMSNHPIGGPVFSGPQVRPWVCTTEANGLGAPLDGKCNAPAGYELLYRSTEGAAYKTYDPANPPSDVAQTTTDNGETVPYIVRRERGAMNRGLYQISVLFDPSQGWTAWEPQRGWNRKLFYPFGASCNTNYGQGSFDEATMVHQA